MLGVEVHVASAQNRNSVYDCSYYEIENARGPINARSYRGRFEEAPPSPRTMPLDSA